MREKWKQKEQNSLLCGKKSIKTSHSLLQTASGRGIPSLKIIGTASYPILLIHIIIIDIISGTPVRSAEFQIIKSGDSFHEILVREYPGCRYGRICTILIVLSQYATAETVSNNIHHITIIKIITYGS